MPRTTTSVRALAQASFEAALRQANERPDGYLVLTAASFAGYVLLMSGGDMHRARSLVPGDREGFSAEVHARLDAVATSEMVLAELETC